MILDKTFIYEIFYKWEQLYKLSFFEPKKDDSKKRVFDPINCYVETLNGCHAYVSAVNRSICVTTLDFILWLCSSNSLGLKKDMPEEWADMTVTTFYRNDVLKFVNLI